MMLRKVGLKELQDYLQMIDMKTNWLRMLPLKLLYSYYKKVVYKVLINIVIL